CRGTANGRYCRFRCNKWGGRSRWRQRLPARICRTLSAQMPRPERAARKPRATLVARRKEWLAGLSSMSLHYNGPYSMNAGIVGTGAISHKHAQAYKNIGFRIAACTDINPANAKAFAEKHGGVAVASVEDICKIPEVDFVDVCTFPDFRLQPVELAARYKKHVQLQKPMAINTEVCRKMIELAKAAGIVLGVVSQHRFDDSCLFLRRAIDAGRLGRLIQCDAYVKWYRSAEYYSRPIKGSWATEGGGALINQAIHQIDVLRWLAGPVKDIKAMWQLGALHKIESEDVVNALLRYENGATGVIQASTALWPGYSERVELHGTKGSAIVTGDQLTAWD